MTAILKAYGKRNGRFKTPSEKYSSNLNENPIGSFNFINPEMIKRIPTKNLDNCAMNFIYRCIMVVELDLKD
jgi:hypothetical protein